MRIVLLSICVLFYRPALAQAQSGSVGPIGTFIQTNIIGFPVIHNEQTWIFDPDISLRRRKQFIAENGDKGERLVEKLGLGIDGYEDERLRRQRIRDEGHLGGLNAYLP